MHQAWIEGSEQGGLESAVACGDENESGTSERGGCHRREGVVRLFQCRVERKGGQGRCGLKASHLACECESLSESGDGGRGRRGGRVIREAVSVVTESKLACFESFGVE